MQANIYISVACPKKQFGPVFLRDVAPGGAGARQDPAANRAGIDLYDTSRRCYAAEALDDAISWLLPPLDVTHDVLLRRA